MKEVLTPTDATDPALLTVKLLLACIIVIEFALGAEVTSKKHPAVHTVRPNRLTHVADGTDDFAYCLAVEQMSPRDVLPDKHQSRVDGDTVAYRLVVIFCGIVTMATPEDFVAARCHDATTTLVVFAA